LFGCADEKGIEVVREDDRRGQASPASTGTACSDEDRQNTNNHPDAMLDLR
jgi:hypothetical protein